MKAMSYDHLRELWISVMALELVKASFEFPMVVMIY